MPIDKQSNLHSREEENAKALGIQRSKLQKPAATKREVKIL